MNYVNKLWATDVWTLDSNTNPLLLVQDVLLTPLSNIPDTLYGAYNPHSEISIPSLPPMSLESEEIYRKLFLPGGFVEGGSM